MKGVPFALAVCCIHFIYQLRREWPSPKLDGKEGQATGSRSWVVNRNMCWLNPEKCCKYPLYMLINKELNEITVPHSELRNFYTSFRPALAKLQNFFRQCFSTSWEMLHVLHAFLPILSAVICDTFWHCAILTSFICFSSCLCLFILFPYSSSFILSVYNILWM